MKPKLALALGAGGARGWCHIGAIRALEEAGFYPDVVCGASMGALVGAAYTSGVLADLEAFARTLKPASFGRFLDINLGSGGLIEGGALERQLVTLGFKDDFNLLDRPFIAVASDLYAAREVWIRQGSVAKAVRASIALPGILAPFFHEERWLMDGGMTNPVPVSACRALGGDIIIAVDPNSLRFSGRFQQGPERSGGSGVDLSGFIKAAPQALQPYLQSVMTSEKKTNPKPPGYFSVLSASIDLMTDQIRRSRMAGEPPHVFVSASLNHISTLDFHLASEAIELGYLAMKKEAGSIAELMQG